MDNFDHLVTILRAGLAKSLTWGDGKLYTTDAKGMTVQVGGSESPQDNFSEMAEAYLGGFSDPVRRQYHNCSCCKDFLNRFGTLAVMKDGVVASAMFSFIFPHRIATQQDHEVMAEFKTSLAEMCDRVLSAKITGVFVSSEINLGTAQTGVWKHFAVTNPLLYSGRKITAGQRRAEMVEEHRMLAENLPKYRMETFAQAVALLDTETMYRSDKFLGLAKKLLALKQATDVVRGSAKDNLIWQAVAQGDPAVAHFNSGVISTLLEDLQAGLDYGTVNAKFDAKTGALTYRVPTAAPKAGQVKAAEDLVAKLGLAPAFERRYATVDEVSGTSLWKWEGGGPGQVHKATQPGLSQTLASRPIFGDLLPKAAATAPAHAGAKVITWVKFRELMMTAQAIQFLAQDGLPYGAITTGPEVEGVPLFKHAGPLSTMCWTAADASQFNLVAGTWVKVDMIVPSPADREACLFVIPHIFDKEREKAGLGLYPELLHADLQTARSTIMAHSSKGVLPEKSLPELGFPDLAMGVVVSKRLTLGMTFRVTKAGVAIDYTVDRWD